MAAFEVVGERCAAVAVYLTATSRLNRADAEGYMRYHTVVGRDGGLPKGAEIVRNGPIATIVTSARNHIEDELVTRLMPADSDEGLPQSSKVLISLLDAAGLLA